MSRAASPLAPPLASPVARILLCAFVVLHAGLAITGTPGGVGWPILIALALISGAAAAVVLVPGGALPSLWTAAALAAMLLGDAVVTTGLPLGGWAGYAAWHLGASTFVLLAIALRERARAAWLGMAAMVLEVVLWSVATGQGVWHGVDLVDRQAGTLLIGTLFAVGLRRAGRTLEELQEREHERVTEQLDLTAARLQRRSEARVLLDVIDPALSTILTAERLSPDERSALRSLEGRLRDRIVAPHLDHEGLHAAVAEARARGVDVTLLSDIPSASGSAGLAEALDWLAARAAEVDGPMFVGRVVERDGRIRASAVTADGQDVMSVPVELRGTSQIRPRA